MPSKHSLVALELDFSKSVLSLDISLGLLVTAAVVLVAAFLFLRYGNHLGRAKYSIVDLQVAIGTDTGITFKVKRDTTNLYIAHRIYLELVTRKAAIPLEEDKDVIVEVYDSWYKLFGLIRDEIKALPGDYLLQHDMTKDLVALTLRILNEGLRPHLTTYQADFRRWYAAAKELPANKDKSPQEIQKGYPRIDALFTNMQEVNGVLKDFADQLYKLIHGNSPS